MAGAAVAVTTASEAQTISRAPPHAAIRMSGVRCVKNPVAEHGKAIGARVER
jgi:hypothetical protein